MCMAKIVKEQDDGSNLLCGNIIQITLEENMIIATDILGKKNEIKGQIRQIDFSESIVVIS